ncbi:MAG: hypothetical protein UU81_C0037G0007 [Microgenomates group bacterium GW2011_GWC1_41_8]|uniref:DUF4446 domain-containing protein n=3 Tax=Candidatus Roizmaniibacteriota TaxID=1752723 RepID=A0A0G0ZK22_9BACT|nr:MAG: hypothetical protein UU14_C0019G0007 [Candidatus Roizmanbacteria bacterium GW2011_GWB1_40_7]KKS22401.1 MAG: hypothetical protein UU78_C0017G0005 [Candidatus Roizmanbacteria bacterium GW2011_GWC2_41_7]KKS23219.1 MAG: hypothetical protein UU81_C0037G0007 [Microgenomates group bacterium GW2011_GWC1_41_8]
MSEQFGIVSIIFFLLLVIWLAGVTYFLFQITHHYNSLVRLTDRRTLSSMLDKLISQAKGNQDGFIQLEQRVREQERKSQFQIQKIGLLRYNPFADTGGEQSFVVSLLDQNNSGIILTSLQGRSGTRWYAKLIKKGKGIEFDLSKDEEEALKKAKQLS